VLDLRNAPASVAAGCRLWGLTDLTSQDMGQRLMNMDAQYAYKSLIYETGSCLLHCAWIL